MSEGHRHLFLLALQHRFHGRWQEARHTLEEAARQGSGDACWYLYAMDTWGGYYGEEGQQTLTEEAVQCYATQGAKWGNPICAAVRSIAHGMVKANLITRPCNLAAEIVLVEMFGYRNMARVFSDAELALLRREAEQAIVIHDMWPVSLYFHHILRTRTDWKAVMKTVDPRLIGHALSLIAGDHGASFEFDCEDYHNWIGFDFFCVIERNCFSLDTYALLIVKCVVGKTLTQQNLARYQEEDNQRHYKRFYRRCKHRADSAVLVWLGCFRRGAFAPWLSRDTVTLVAKMVADPVLWATTTAATTL